MLTPVSPESLFARLRAATSPYHNDIEKTIDPMKRLQSRDQYRQLLEKMWGFYRPTEEALARLDWPATAVDFAARRKTPWLAKDLVALGVKTELLPTANQFPEPRTLAEGMGCLYVLEGATLGGQIIAQHLKKIGVGPDTGGSFYASYGDKIGDMWAQFPERNSLRSRRPPSMGGQSLL